MKDFCLVKCIIASYYNYIYANQWIINYFDECGFDLIVVIKLILHDPGVDALLII